jgi:hypothetical protein
MTGAMLRRLIASLLVSFLLALPAAPALADPADIAAASRGVVRVVIVQTEGRNSTMIGHGSGFAVTPEYVVTNAHVVEALRQDDTLIAGVVPPEGAAAMKPRLSPIPRATTWPCSRSRAAGTSRRFRSMPGRWPTAPM